MQQRENAFWTWPIAAPRLRRVVAEKGLREMLAVEATALNERFGQAERHVGVVGVGERTGVGRYPRDSLGAT